MNTNFDITTDLFLGGKLKIQQYKKGFKSGSDAVLLASFIPSLSGNILEVGCGVGVASLCLVRRLSDIHITGIDIDETLIQLATRNAKDNGLDARCTFLTQDITKDIRDKGLPPQTFDHVFSNPPYFDGSSPSPVPERAVARSHTIPLREWVAYCIKMVKPRGRLSFIYPTTSLHSLLGALEGVGDIRLLPLWPSADKPSKRILVSARKGVKGGLTLEQGLVLHGLTGVYTREAQQILKEGEGLADLFPS
ncbi:MAG: hypothetical protein A2977_01485 [Alphaproteobacteria bacterium RIFCSPLOWO2_01_FULL_45_8]|nr:MAG: hypothetical protein A2065_04850 [Alphaproteobacteria bacterium GWB1_45_5]OFW90300.1 MAG: hypothetical protein A2621_04910 [Alphaproteobacteria bacterium RIFCSPHIGHO2_01_FULL_41_14]OFW95735.1 MAG: hypothetical protein A2977_01485 [Alphaproteobacteria bacterium RIFCSPLOWO2_01_FULL_45_8]HCI48596.1 hypothetical protein [Holosporales bacterium]